MHYAIRIILIVSSFTPLLNSCQTDRNDDSEVLIWQINETSNTFKIQGVLDSIEFTFCLMDSNGIPSIEFKEGDNMYFYFKLKNNSSQNLYLDPTLFEENDFCKVINISGNSMGQPFNYCGNNKLGLGGFPFFSGEIYEVSIPWEDPRTEYWYAIQAVLQSTHQDHLPKGQYYVKFTHRFRFYKGYDTEMLYVGPLTFIINFSVI